MLNEWEIRPDRRATPWLEPAVAHTIRGNNSAIEIINSLGLTSGLQLVLDAGDAASYTSGDKWLDRSGGGYDFDLGAAGGADAADPTFAGTAGRLSSAERFSFDGGDRFTYDTTNEAWMQTLHKDNATLSMVFWVNPATDAANKFLFGTSGGGAANIGVRFGFADQVGTVVLNVANGSGTLALSKVVNLGVTAGAWQMLAVSVDEAANSGTLFRNGTVDTGVGAYSSPSASNATFTAQIAAAGNNILSLVSGSLLAIGMIWTVALSVDQLNAIFTATRGRFGV